MSDDFVSDSHAPKLDKVSRTIDELVGGGFLDNLDDTDLVVAQVIERLSSGLVSDRSRELTRGSVLFDLQRRDVEHSRDPGRRLVCDGDGTLIEHSLRNADEYLHDEFPGDGAS